MIPGFLLLAGNFEPSGKNEGLLYEKTGELLLLMSVSVGFGFCLLAGLPLYAAGAICSIAGEVLLWGGIVWLVLKNLLKNRKWPYWQISIATAFIGLFLIGGMTP